MRNIDWQKILISIAGDISRELDLDIVAENYILDEISDRINNTLTGLHMQKPNVAKIAGVVTFWVRKLKPFSYSPSDMAKGAKLSPLNELIAIQSGLAICYKYNDDYSRSNFKLSKRLLKDWLHTLRFHSHSPHSSLFAFELLTTEDEDNKSS
jgi:hypothetical protein